MLKNMTVKMTTVKMTTVKMRLVNTGFLERVVGVWQKYVSSGLKRRSKRLVF